MKDFRRGLNVIIALGLGPQLFGTLGLAITGMLIVLFPEPLARLAMLHNGDAGIAMAVAALVFVLFARRVLR